MTGAEDRSVRSTLSRPERATLETPLARLLGAIAAAATPLAHVIRRGPLAARLRRKTSDRPKHDDLLRRRSTSSPRRFRRRPRSAPACAPSCPKSATIRSILNDDGAFLVALDPLDGSSNINVNSPSEPLFSVIDAPAGGIRGRHFLQPGVQQRAAGFLLYGPQVGLMFTVGTGVHAATLDPDTGAFSMSRIGARIPRGQREFAINASNSRHWPAPVRAYIDDCLEGRGWPARQEFQHALGRRSRRRRLPDSRARRRLPLSGGSREG